MTDLILGVDPGKYGALAVLDLDGRLIDVADMPDATGSALGTHLRDHLADYQPDRIVAAWVEKVGSRPGQGHMNVWTFALGHGAVLGALGALGIPVHLVPPGTWKKNQRVTAAKGTSRQRATELWPEHARSFTRVKDDGRAESALIARYGWMAGR